MKKTYRCYILFIGALLNTSMVVGQNETPAQDEVIFGTFHLTNYWDDDIFTTHSYEPGFAVEYRKNIDSLKANFHLSLGIVFESVPIKNTIDGVGYFKTTHLNFSIPIGLYYNIGNSYYVGLYTSMDFPIAQKQEDDFQGFVASNTEFTFRFLNINFSGGMNVGRIVTIGKKVFSFEVHGKVLGLLGLKSNDYWHYPQDNGIPYYGGIRMGYAF